MFSTRDVLALRADLDGGNPPPGSFLHALQADRRSFRSRIAGLQFDAVIAAFHGVWELATRAPADAWYHLPPLYMDENVRCILSTAVTGMVARERGHVTDSTNNVGHLVLHGIEGTGKSTLMKALAVGAAVLLTRLLPVVHTYNEAECDVPPTRLLRAALRLLGQEAPDDHTTEHMNDAMYDASDRLRACGHEVMLCLDEFQHVFALPESGRDVSRQVAAASQVHTLSRRGGTLCVIAGSAAHMRVVMYRTGSLEAPDRWRRAGFPDFNASLYDMCHVPALRTVAALRDFVATRYPRWALTDADVAQLLYWTGGIGRVVHQAWLLNGVVEGEGCAGIDRAARALAAMSEGAGSRRLLPGDVFVGEDLAAQVAATAIVLRHATSIAEDARRETRRLPCVGCPVVDMVACMRAAGITEPSGHLRRLSDHGLLYEHPGWVELARPCDAHVCAGWNLPRAEEVFLLTAVKLMVEGVYMADCGTPAGERDEVTTHVNAGNALERLVRGRVLSLICPAVLDPTPPVWEVCITAWGALAARRLGTPDWEPLTLATVQTLDSQLLLWHRETGLDGLVLQRVSETGGDWVLRGWQCKGGHASVDITGGRLETSTAHFVTTGSVSTLNDSSLHGILVKAQVGMCKVIAAWLATFSTPDGPTLLPASLTITTTKRTVRARLALRDMGGAMKLDPSVAARVSPSLRGRSRRVARVLAAPIAVDLHDGTGWVRQCVPPPCATLAAHLLPASVSEAAGGASGEGGGDDGRVVAHPGRHRCVVM